MKDANKLKNLIWQGDASQPQVGDSGDFQLLLRLSNWAALSSVPFSKSRQDLSLRSNKSINESNLKMVFH